MESRARRAVDTDTSSNRDSENDSGSLLARQRATEQELKMVRVTERDCYAVNRLMKSSF